MENPGGSVVFQIPLHFWRFDAHVSRKCFVRIHGEWERGVPFSQTNSVGTKKLSPNLICIILVRVKPFWQANRTRLRVACINIHIWYYLIHAVFT